MTSGGILFRVTTKKDEFGTEFVVKNRTTYVNIGKPKTKIKDKVNQ